MPTSSPGSLLRRFPLTAYFAIAYLVTWALLLPLALSARGVLAAHIPPEWHALGALGPLTAAFLVTRAGGGAPAVRAWLSGFMRWRTHPGWWLLAVGSPFALFAVSAVLVWLAGGAWPDLARLGLPAYANRSWLTDLLFVGTLAYGIGEEPGWRGFALPRLERRAGPLGATLILTPLWAIWHWPAFLYRAGYQGGLPTVIGFVFGLLAGAIVLTFLYDGTRGSLLLVALWHVLINVTMEIASVVSQPVVATMNVLVAVAAVGIAIGWLRLGRRRAPADALPAELRPPD
jgi:membrane protease YdiL (CAAX protease family)